jgi:hypothetical protein
VDRQSHGDLRRAVPRPAGRSFMAVDDLLAACRAASRGSRVWCHGQPVGLVDQNDRNDHSKAGGRSRRRTPRFMAGGRSDPAAGPVRAADQREAWTEPSERSFTAADDRAPRRRPRRLLPRIAPHNSAVSGAGGRTAPSTRSSMSWTCGVHGAAPPGAM